MADWSEFGQEIIKLASRPRYSFCLWFGCGVLLAFGSGLSFLRLDGIRNDYGQWIGLFGFFAFIVWTVEVVLLGWNKWRRGVATRRAELKAEEEQERAERKVREERESAERKAQEEEAKVAARVRETQEQAERESLEYLDALDPWEAGVLLAGVVDSRQTVYCSDAPLAGSLVAKRLLTRAADTKAYQGIPYIIPRFVWKHINRSEEVEKLKAKVGKAG